MDKRVCHLLVSGGTLTLDKTCFWWQNGRLHCFCDRECVCDKVNIVSHNFRDSLSRQLQRFVAKYDKAARDKSLVEIINIITIFLPDNLSS